jgi:hypothetical protein
MATEILRPNAAGDEENISNVVGDGVGTHYTVVDEETPDDDSTYVYNQQFSSPVFQRDLYNLPASSGSGTINKITVHFRCKMGNASSKAKASIKSDSTVTDGDEKVATETGVWENHSQEWATNPADSEAWEWADIDNLQIGVSLKGSYSYCRCTQVYVEVDYTAGGGATEKSSSDSGSGTDAYVSLQTPSAKSSSDAGSGAEGTPVPSAILAGSETGSGIEALVARLLAVIDSGYGAEVVDEVGGLFKNLFATELGEGSDLLTAKIEMPTKGGGMKLWT